MTCTWVERQALGRQFDAVETPGVGGGLRIGEMERAAAEQIGLQRNPGLQVRAALNDHAGAGRAGHVETKHAACEAKRRVRGDDAIRTCYKFLHNVLACSLFG